MKKGFTLVELLGVIVILGILSLLVFPMILNQMKETKGKLNKATERILYSAANLYIDANQNTYGYYEGDVYCVTLQMMYAEGIIEKPILDANGNEVDFNLFIEASVVNKKGLSYKFVESCTEVNQKPGIADEPDLPPSGNTDQIPPEIFGADNIIIAPGSTFDALAGIRVVDNLDGEIPNSKVIVIGSVNPSILGSYTVIYKVSDAAGNMTTVTRIVGVANEITDFAYTGNYQTFTVPVSGIYRVQLWGATGSGSAGTGGYTAGDIYLKGGEVLYFYVGGSGKGGTGSGTAGWNGGGAAGTTGGSGGGGGATDVRLLSGSSFESLKSRIMVAGGSGGSESSSGGAGGGLFGVKNNAGSQASQTRGASFGTGCSYSGDGSGAGGGYYGGYCPTADSVGGGGGSSYISGHHGCSSIDQDSTSSSLIHTGSSIHYSGYYFTNTVMIDGAGMEWAKDKGVYVGVPAKGVAATSNGYAKITVLKIEEKTEQEIEKEKNDTYFIYAYSGNTQKFIAPLTGRYKFELWGAAGSGSAGPGGYTAGEMQLEKGETFYLYVGSAGGGGAGWNGGGSPGTTGGSGGGGGATDIRLVTGSATTVDGIRSRIMVAGGSGASENGTGGVAGGLLGYGNNAGRQATQQVGYSLGKGCNYSGDGSGGGGGYYGGYCPTADVVGGGGGSSYISGHDGCLAINADGTSNSVSSIHYSNLSFMNTLMIDGYGYQWTTVKGNYVGIPEQVKGNNVRDGYAKVTYLGP